MNQLVLIPKPNLSSGGSLMNTRSQKRVLCSKSPTHLVLKCCFSVNLYRHKFLIDRIISKQAKTFGIIIYSFSIQKDHVHLNVRISSRDAYIKFIRAVTGLIAKNIQKGLWILRPFTRIGHWGRDFKNVKNYVFQNEMEVQGIWKYKPRKNRPKKANESPPKQI